MSHNKQFTLYTTVRGPNGWKVEVVLEELGLSYESIYLKFGQGEHKKPKFTQYNPNGRIPALVDHHNGDFVIWESDAILLYLTEKYDKDHKLSVVDEKDKFHLVQWLFFQGSGQGPYFGQAGWFNRFHHEKLPSVIERYNNEVKRVFGVLEGVLSERKWLVGGKPTIADLSFITWTDLITSFVINDLEILDLAKDFPAVYAWHTKLISREPVNKVFTEMRAKLQKSE